MILYPQVAEGEELLRGARKELEGKALCLSILNDFLSTRRKDIVHVQRETACIPHLYLRGGEGGERGREGRKERGR